MLIWTETENFNIFSIVKLKLKFCTFWNLFPHVVCRQNPSRRQLEVYAKHVGNEMNGVPFQAFYFDFFFEKHLVGIG